MSGKASDERCSNEAFHGLTAELLTHTEQTSQNEEWLARSQSEITATEKAMRELQDRLDALRKAVSSATLALEESRQGARVAEAQLEELKPRLVFHQALPESVMWLIMGQQCFLGALRASEVCTEWSTAIAALRDAGKLTPQIRSISASHGSGEAAFNMFCTAKGVFTCGSGIALGHGEGAEAREFTPRQVEALNTRGIVGVDAGLEHAVAWSEEGEAFTWGAGRVGKLGHCEESQDERVPRPVQGLSGRRVIGASAGVCVKLLHTPHAGVNSGVAVMAGRWHTVAWTDGGELYSWGSGKYGALGHGIDSDEHIPRH